MLPALAAAVGPDGRVTALDADAEAVAAATALVAAAGLSNVAVRMSFPGPRGVTGQGRSAG
jgi:predicted O-methyltransferase YrrM